MSQQITPQDAFNNLAMVLDEKCTMSGREHKIAAMSLKVLSDTVNQLVAKVQAFEAEKAQELPVDALPIGRVPQAESDAFNGEAHP